MCFIEVMAKEEHVETEGKIIELLRGVDYKIQLESGHTVIARASGKMRKSKIRLCVGDKVTLKLSPYDLTKGIITYRLNK